MANFAQMNPGVPHLGYKFTDMPVTDTVPQDVEGMVNLKFKTAVVVNRVVYVGNVQKTDLKGQTIVEDDAMYKSSVNKFDTFSSLRKIEASIRDGDAIVKIEEYADRILQFKKNKMHLINVSQDIEFLEDTFLHKGVSHPASVCKTDYGIAWANNLGCYLYDGQKVTNLFEKSGRQIIKEDEWAKFLTASKNGTSSALTPMVGYLPKKRQIIIFDDIDNNSTTGPRMYLYDMVTQSWVKGDNDSSQRLIDIAKTNFVIDWDGDLIYAHTTDQGTFVKWDDSGDATDTILLNTKDIDFGQPAVRKKVYKVYVSYRGDGSAVNIRYGVDGETDNSTPDTYQFNSTDTPLVDKSSAANLESWHKAELIPTTSSEANNINSFRLFFKGTAGATFEINDISIVYRIKSVK
jgi:hypothetical protein